MLYFPACRITISHLAFVFLPPSPGYLRKTAFDAPRELGPLREMSASRAGDKFPPEYSIFPQLNALDFPRILISIYYRFRPWLDSSVFSFFLGRASSGCFLWIWSKSCIIKWMSICHSVSPTQLTNRFEPRSMTLNPVRGLCLLF